MGTESKSDKEQSNQLRRARLGTIMLTGFSLLLLVLLLTGGSNGSRVGAVLLLIPVAGLTYRQMRRVAGLQAAIQLAEQERVRLTSQRKQLATELAGKAGHEPIPAAVMGGSGFPLQAGSVALLSFRTGSVAFTDPESAAEFEISYADLLNIDISGPGKVTTNAGLIGGGFGVEGAIKGILAAAVVNKLTTKVTIQTTLRLSTASGEVHLLLTTVDLPELRLLLSRAFVRLEARRQSPATTSLATELERLRALTESGTLSEAEFAAAKSRLLSAARE